MNIPLTPIRFLERSIRIYKDKTAAVCGHHRFSYRDYGARVSRFSNALLQLGIGKGDRVAYLGYNCHRLLEAYYAVPQIGAVLEPLNIRLSPRDFRYIIRESGPSLLFLDSDFVSAIEGIRSDIPSVQRFILLDGSADRVPWISDEYETFLASAPPAPPFETGGYPFDEDDTAEIFYTSGTTGKPKGVMLTHRNLYLHALETLAVSPMDETDIQLHLIPLFHVNGWGTPHYLTAKGGTHVMLKTFDALECLRTIEREKVTRFYIVPTMLNAVLNHPDLKKFNLSTVRDILVGGAPPPTGMMDCATEAFGCLVHGGFGMSETCPLIAWPELGPNLDPRVREYRAKRTWGFPMLGVEYKVVDPVGKELPWDGESIGELLVRGDMVMKGYYGSLEETEKALEGGWYHSGDLVSMGPDGSLFIKDRKKEIIISGGENISSLEVEQALYSHPDVVECAVVGKEDTKWGEVPVAFVVTRKGSQVTPQGIIDFARSKTAHFKAPKEVFVVEELPKGGTGKIMKAVLRQRVRKSS